MGEKYYNFNKTSLQKQFELREKELIDSVSTVAVPEITWSQQVAKCLEIISKICVLLHHAELDEEYSDILKFQLQNFLHACQYPEFQIALVGFMNVGKTSLINAILGEELVSAENCPDTSVLTKICIGKSNEVTIHFYTKDEWLNLWNSASLDENSKFISEYRELCADLEMNQWVGHAPLQLAYCDKDTFEQEVRRWTSRSPAQFFVKEITITCPSPLLPEGLVLVDTPGLDDAVEYRSQISKKYIQYANAVFVCVKIEKLTDTTIQTVHDVFSDVGPNKEKVYIIGTQQDKLSNPKEDWAEHRKEWLELLGQKFCFGEQRLAIYHLLSTSGLLFSLLTHKDYLDGYRSSDLEAMLRKWMNPINWDKNRTQLIDLTGIDTLRQRIQTDIISICRVTLQQSLIHDYHLLCETITHQIQLIKAQQMAFLDLNGCATSNDRAAIRDSLSDLENAKRELVQVDSTINQIMSRASKEKKELMSKLQAYLKS